MSAAMVKSENTIPAMAEPFLLLKPIIPKIKERTARPKETKIPKPYIPAKRNKVTIARIETNKLVNAI